MKFADRGSALSRRIVLILGVVAVLATARVASAQAAAPPPDDPFQFKTPMGWILWQVRADKVADFESAWVAVKTKFAASEKPEHKAVAESLKMYKPETDPVDVANVGKVAFYYFVVDPASQTQSYNPTALLYETGDLFPRAEADAIFEKLKGALLGLEAKPLKRLQ
jgi:hypothetical protein